jgi:monoterpene epsilon-lactone hydrolase
MSLTFTLLVAGLRLGRRRSIYADEAAVRQGIAAVRRAGPALPGARLRRQLQVEESTFEGRQVFRLRPPGLPEGGKRLIYLHGGAYVRPMTSHHWRLVRDLALRTPCEVVVPFYPLAPESRSTDTLAWAQRLYAQWARPGHTVVLGGDSAGAGLAMALSQSLLAAGHRGPDRLLLITPAVDWSLDTPAVAAIAPHDPMLMPAGAVAATRMYAGDLPLSDWRFTPAKGPLAGLPPTLLLTAGRDILAPGGQALARQMQGAGVDVHLWHAPRMIHVWPVLPAPEGRSARESIARWLQAS